MNWKTFDKKNYSSFNPDINYILCSIETGQICITYGYIYEELDENTDKYKNAGWCWNSDFKVTHFAEIELPNNSMSAEMIEYGKKCFIEGSLSTYDGSNKQACITLAELLYNDYLKIEI